MIISIIFIMIFLITVQPLPRGNTATSTTTSVSSSTAETTFTETTLRSAPDFALPEIDSLGLTGEMGSLSQFSGRPVFLEFMSPLCGHCVKMTPVIKEIEEKYGDRVVFISVMYGDSSSEEFREIASEFIKKHGTDWVHLVDNGRVFKEYGVEGTPTYVILDREHREVARFIGSGTTEEALEDALKKVL